MARVFRQHNRRYDAKTWRPMGTPRPEPYIVDMPEASGYLTVMRCKAHRRATSAAPVLEDLWPDLPAVQP